MTSSEHLIKRISQRGISKDLLMSVLRFGFNDGDKVLLNRKNVLTLLQELNILKKNLLKISDKGGVTVVIGNNTLITAYNTNSFTKNIKG